LAFSELLKYIFAFDKLLILDGQNLLEINEVLRQLFVLERLEKLLLFQLEVIYLFFDRPLISKKPSFIKSKIFFRLPVVGEKLLAHTE
jgi:hypothetical protein